MKSDWETFKSRSDVRRIFLILSSVAYFNLILFPDAVRDRLSDFEPGFVVNTIGQITEVIAAPAQWLGLPAMVTQIRTEFLHRYVKGARSAS